MPHKLKLHKCCKIHSNVFVTYALDLDLSLLSLLVLNTLLNNYPFLVARSPFISHFSLSPHHLYFYSRHFLPSEILPVLKFSLNKKILSPVLNLLIKLYLKIKKKTVPKPIHSNFENINEVFIPIDFQRKQQNLFLSLPYLKKKSI